MTRKETALENLRNMLNKYCDATGNNVYIDSVIYNMRKSTISDINSMIESYEYKLNKFFEEASIKEFFDSKEGSRAKLVKQARQVDIAKEQDILMKKTVELINEEMQKAGINIYPYSVRGIVNNRWILENSLSSKKYYLQIEIDFLRYFWNPENTTPGINVAALGTIDMIGSSEGKNYYMTIGKLFENADTIYEIFNKLCGKDSEYFVKHTSLEKEFDEINYWLSNPLKEVA